MESQLTPDWQKVDRPTTSLSEELATAFTKYDTSGIGYVHLNELSPAALSRVSFVARGIWSADDMAKLNLKPDGELLYSILREHDMYLTGAMSLKTFKMAVQELASRQLGIEDGVGKMLELEAEYDGAIAGMAAETAALKDGFNGMQAKRLEAAKAEKAAAKEAYVDGGQEDEEGISIEEFESRVKLRLAFKKAGENVTIIENEGQASLSLRLQTLTLKQNDTFAAQTAEMNEKKAVFVDKVVSTRDAKEAAEAAETAAIAVENKAAEEKRLAIALEEQAEHEAIRKEMESLRNTVRSRIESEMGVTSG